jgi:site-specific recombinase XerD
MGPARAYLAGLAPSSRATMRASLNKLARFFGAASVDELAWHTLRYDDSQRLRSHLLERYKGRTVNRVLAAYRGVLKSAWMMGRMSAEDMHHATAVKQAYVSEPLAGRRLSMDELRALVRADDDKRGAAIVAVMYAAGLRRFELTRLKRSDYDPETSVLTVRGKRNKVRTVKLNEAWRAPLVAWLRESAGKSKDCLFPSQRKPGQPLTVNGVAAILEARRVLAGVAPFTPHDLRRTLITNLIDSGVDLVVVKRIAGHEHVNTTALYDRRGQAAEEAAVDKLEGL